MARFFIHIQQGSEWVEDVEGEEFSSFDEMRKMAIASAREIMSEMVSAGHAPDGRQFTIVDEAGQTVLVVPFKDAIA